MQFKKILIIGLFCWLLLSNQAVGFHQLSPKQFKANLLHIYSEHLSTFFCEHPFESTGFTLIRYCRSCPKQSTHIQWMMIMSSNQLAKELSCYQEKLCTNKRGERYKGIKCCQKISEKYQQLEQDLHNWVPELHALVRARQQFPFGIIPVHDSPNRCQLYFDRKLKMVEPPPAVRGFIARTYLYMSDKYHLSLSSEEYRLYLQWHKQYPPTAWEITRNEKIRAIQGDGNSYLY